MPFTPYHFGPALLIGVVLFPFVDIIAILVGSVILDLEPLLLLLTGSNQPLHGISHTYFVATIASLISTGVIWLIRDPLYEILSFFKINQQPSIKKIGISSIIGTYSHVLLDSFLYPEMNPLFPILGNPFLGLVSSAVIYQFCVYCGIIGFFVYLLRFILRSSTTEESSLVF